MKLRKNIMYMTDKQYGNEYLTLIKYSRDRIFQPLLV
jgi:hypothetical protein